MIIPDINRGWNRAGQHWCSKLCYEEDHGYANQVKQIPTKQDDERHFLLGLPIEYTDEKLLDVKDILLTDLSELIQLRTKKND